MGENIQYVIIAVVFAAAVFFVVRKFMPKKGKGSSCNKGCGCDFTKQDS
jgi:hypothetical protein